MTYIQTTASRIYTAPPSPHNLGMDYLWDSTYVNGVKTGNWRPVLETDYISVAAAFNDTPWQTVSSSGFVQRFSPLSGAGVVNRINGYSQCETSNGFIQIFDSTGQVGFPMSVLTVQSGNNFFYDLAEHQGVSFTNGLTVANSSHPINIVTGARDFFVTVVYKMM